MAVEGNTRDGQYTIDVLTEARDKCFVLCENPELDMEQRNQLEVRYTQIDQLIDELLTKEFHNKGLDEDGAGDLASINSKLEEKISALNAAVTIPGTAVSVIAVLDQIIKTASPLVAQ